MIIVAGTFEVEPSERQAFLDSRAEVMRASRAEAGCRAYVFSADPLEPGRVQLYELWDDQASLDAHLTALRARGPLPGTVAPTSSEILRYEVTSLGPLG